MKPFSVLIVEDNEVDAELLKRIVERTVKGAAVEWCWDGLEALVRVGNLKPDLLFLDYMMPKTDGMDFLKNARELKACEQCRIAVVSAYVEPGNVDKFRKLGADDVISKPIVVSDIVEVIKKAQEPKKRPAKKTSGGGPLK